MFVIQQPRILQNQAHKTTPQLRLRRTAPHDLGPKVRETAISHNGQTTVKLLSDSLRRVFRFVDRSDAEDLSGVGLFDQFTGRPFEHVYARHGFRFFP